MSKLLHPDDRLKALVAPSRVAVIGASANPDRLTARPISFMLKHGFRGEIVPVNPVRPEVAGLPAVATIAEAPGPVDHAYILLPTDEVIPALERCAKAGVKVVSVLADGFAEAGPEGRARQKRAAAIAREAGMLLIGPNSTGVVATHAGFVCTTNAAFAVPSLVPGGLAVLSQSGNMIGTILSRGQSRGIGFSTLISTGNEAAAGIGDLGMIMVSDPASRAFLLFLETVRDPQALAQFARAASHAGKPVLAYVLGRSDEGQALSISHTGALTGSNVAVSAFLREIGVIEVENFATLIEGGAAFSALGADCLGDRPRSATVVSTTGGGGAMLLDQLSARGVAIAACSPAAKAHFEEAAIPSGHGKLVDVTLAGTNYKTMRTVIDTLLRDPDTGLVAVAIGSSAQFNPELSVRPIIDACREAPAGSAPLIAFPLPHAPESVVALAQGGVPAFTAVEPCAEAVALMMRDRLIPQPLPFDEGASLIEGVLDAKPDGCLNELDSGEIFAALSLPRPSQIVLQSEQSVPVDLGFDYPVVAKLISRDLPHKTELGAVTLNIADRAALEKSIEAMKLSAKRHVPGYVLEGVLVQKMEQGVAEILVGLTRDPVVGPVVTVGLGGVLTELYRDFAVCPAPIGRERARRLIEELKAAPLLTGYRSRPKADVDALARTIATFSRLAAVARIREAEINPVLVRGEGEGVVLVDGLIRLETPKSESHPISLEN